MRVFVASTYADLRDYRAAVTRSILSAGNLTEDMLYWPAEELPPLEVSLLRVRGADLVVVLVAHRYGIPAHGHEQSITELEFEEAVRLGIPVLAFIIDADHPWPPRYVERDPELRTLLDSFIRRIKSQVTPGSFTSPESLELAVTRAVTQFMTRTRTSAPGRAGSAPPLEVSRPESLWYSPDSNIQIGVAPDGAPLVLAVRRQVNVSSTLSLVANQLGKDLEEPPFVEIAAQLAQQARAVGISSKVFQTTVDGKMASVYVSSERLANLASPSLLQSMLHGQAAVRSEFASATVRQLTRTVGVPSVMQPTMSSGFRRPSAVKPGLASVGGANRFLCIALEGERTVWSASWVPDENEVDELVLWRPFIEEGLELLDDVRYLIRSGVNDDASPYLLETEDGREYIDKWTDVLTSKDEQHVRASAQIRVPRSSLVRFALQIVENAAAMHSKGQIHGDIKPGNILIGRDGGFLIDEVGLTVGEISPTVTLGWSPQEQLLRQPLSGAADVYPIGQILMHILEAEPLGREVNFRMPGGNVATVFDNPTVYLSPDSPTIRPGQRQEWCQLIEKALRTDPAERWPSAVEMADAMRSIFDPDSFSGDVRIQLPWGDRPVLMYDRNGELTAGWVMGAPRSQATAATDWI